jgi:hypothetical protein
MPPIFIYDASIAQDQPGVIPVCRTIWIFMAKLNMHDFINRDIHLPSKTFDKSSAFHMTTKKPKCEPDAFTKNRVFTAKKLHGLDKTWDSNNCIATGYSSNDFENL